MVLGPLLMIVTGLLWSGVGVLLSYTARHRMDPYNMLLTSSILCLLVSAFGFVDHAALWGGQASRVPSLAACMIVAGACAAMGTVSMEAGMRHGHNGAVWTISQSALAVPLVLGMLVWGEHVAWHRVGGVAVVLTSLMVFGRLRRKSAGPEEEAARGDGRWLSLALLAFVCYGVQQTLATAPSQWAEWSDAANLRLPLMFAGVCLANAVIVACRRHPIQRRELKLAVILAGLALVSHFLMFVGLDVLGAVGVASIGFPLAIGTAIVGFALYSLLVLRETTRPLQQLGLWLAVVGVVMIAVGGNG